MVSEHSTMADHSTNVTPLQDSGEIPIAGSGLITRQTTSQMTNQSFPSLGQSIEFHPSHFVVKDQKTRLALLQGKIKKGFYKLHATTRAVGDPLTFYSTSSTSNVGSLRLWHNRLGHPSVDVVSKILSLCKIPLKHDNNNSVCESCQLAKSHRLPFERSTSKPIKPFWSHSC